MPVKEYFDKKKCIVTGAASGIGFALTEALLEAGAFVCLADRDQKTLAAAVEQLSAHAARLHSANVDVTSEEQVHSMIEGAVARYGRLDLLFNNAGIGATMPIGAATLEHWRRVIDINLWGVIYGIHYALPIMRRQGGGHIVNTSSAAGLVPFPFQALYCTTKYGVAGLSESLRFELAAENIRVSVVCPGDVATRIYGTPLIGERQEVKPPDNAIPASEAAKIILAGVAGNEGIIALPAQVQELWRQYWTAPQKMEDWLRDLAQQRHRSYQSKGAYY